jgi:hypothetical protein
LLVRINVTFKRSAIDGNVIQFIFMLFLLSPVGGLQVLPAIGM